MNILQLNLILKYLYFMETKVNGIHHVTAIATKAKRNFLFYTQFFGKRLLKKTVNFDEPETYHLYYGDEIGTPGTILTFFAWDDIPPGISGPEQVAQVAYSISEDSLDFWLKRLKSHHIQVTKPIERFDETFISFQDPDGLNIELIAHSATQVNQPWGTNDIPKGMAATGFHSVTIISRCLEETAVILTGLLGYRLVDRKDNRYRFINHQAQNAAIIDLVAASGDGRGLISAGSVHHVAFRVENEAVLMQCRKKIVAAGLKITEKIDRNYFYSVYFREPGGVLFELATDNPGFTVDEPLSQLGTRLQLPRQFESRRAELENLLPSLNS
jgi:glyoxalase family protein